MKAIRHTIKRNDANTTLLAFVATTMRLSRKQAKKLLDTRNVYVNGKRTWMARHTLAFGDVVEAPPPVPLASKPDRTPSILFEDSHYLIINKPGGMLTNGQSSAETILRQSRNEPLLTAAHRLDRDTTGCVIFARTPKARQAIIKIFRNHRVTKIYRAIVDGRINKSERRITMPVQGQRAVTSVRLLDSSSLASYVQMKIETGRTHQIRIHLASMNHPVIGDKQHAASKPTSDASRLQHRHMLHAAIIQFEHPITNQNIRVNAPLPRDFRNCLKSLNLA